MAQKNEGVKILKGVTLVCKIHTLVFTLGTIAAWTLGYLGVEVAALVLFWAVLAIGVAQLIYIIPAIVLLIRQRKWGLMKGVIIGAVLTVLLNGAFWLLFMSN